MKTAKRTFAVLLAIMLLTMNLMVPAVAAGHTIAIETEVDGHTYEAYQIFTGTLNDQGVMTGIAWGSSVSADGQAILGHAETKAGTLKSVADATAFGYEVDDYLTSPVESSNTLITLTNGNKGYEITGLVSGYYLIKDMDASVDSTTHDAYTQYIIQVVDDVNVSPKSSVPTLTKRVSRDAARNYSTAVSAFINGDVYFELAAAMHSHIGDYDAYYMEITDTLPAGLDFAEVVSVTVVNGENYTQADTVAPEHYSVSCEDKKNVTVTIKDAKAAILAATGVDALRDDKILVTYKAKVNDGIVIGEAGNTNAAQMVYSNDPNESYDPVTHLKPTHTGTTPKAEATVYSYEVQLKKVSALNTATPLEGAEFVVSHYKDASTLEYAQVTDGKFTGFVASKDEATKLKTGVDGMIKISGIPSGTLRFEEVTAPSGFNLLTTEISVTIRASLNAATGKLDTFTGEVTGTAHTPVVSKAAGTVLVTVENRPGSTLPETGGVGTTVFYIAGGALLVGALVVLVTRKRSTGK